MPDVDERSFGSRLRTARLASGLTLQQVGDRVGVTGQTISNWETGKSFPNAAKRNALMSLFGLENSADGETIANANAFGAWVQKSRQELKLSRHELAVKAGVSAMQITNIESGKTRNPRDTTRKRLQSALGRDVPQDIQDEAIEESSVPGLGALEDFDPHSKEDWPIEPGVYVLYDVSDRPMYVGKSQNIASRLLDHQEKFWYRPPIVNSASFIRVQQEKLRHQLEQVLIKFLKSNAVINQQGVSR